MPPAHEFARRSDSGSVHARPSVRGKFVYVDDTKVYLRGVTYGTFRPDAQGAQFPCREIVDSDFSQMVDTGINAVRTYTVPPRWLLDLARFHGLYVMVGLAWEQHVAFLTRERARSIEQRIREGVRACAEHPAVLCFAIGNEIPAPIVRWYGRRRVERFLRRLYHIVKTEDADALVTYVNYPGTEYLDLSFVDLVCFNVYLETQDRLEGYLGRLQNIAGDRPLLLAEIGLDSREHGEKDQADVLEWQIRSSFAAGCAGTFIFSWTDEWYSGGQEIDAWSFGLTRRDRRPKPALMAVGYAYSRVPMPLHLDWPRISVVVCSYNGARTIHECCVGLRQLDYPDFEVIVVDDGSTDTTAQIVGEFLADPRFRLITTDNRGLSTARNTGMHAATGDIVAYLDDDAYPDTQWLRYLAFAFLQGDDAAIGGPNIAPAGDGLIADCVAASPGNPVPILLSDTEAEHVPGCNMAIRKVCLDAIGGFDPQFRVAGDDVDVCWRLHERGWRIGFHPAAMVWHHRRSSIRAYWRQQRGYGQAEALLERKWPEKYNAAGQLTWAGRIYGKGVTRPLRWRRSRIYHGIWGSAPFQHSNQPNPGLVECLPLMPEWFLLVALLGLITLAGMVWPPALRLFPFFVLAAGVWVGQAAQSAWHAGDAALPRSMLARSRRWIITTLLHLTQPPVRMFARLRSGLTLWRARGMHRLALPWPRSVSVWSKHWRPAEAWLSAIASDLRASGAIVRPGGDFDPWDLQVRGGLLGAARLRQVIEEHGQGQQLVRFRLWPRCAPAALVVIAVCAILSAMAGIAHDRTTSLLCGALALVLTLRALQESAQALAAQLHILPAAGGADRSIRATQEAAAIADRPTLRLERHPATASSARSDTDRLILDASARLDHARMPVPVESLQNGSDRR